MTVVELREEISIELEMMGAVVAEAVSLIRDVADNEPTVREKTAAAAFLAQFYGGIENILKRIHRYHGIPMPVGDSWHNILGTSETDHDLHIDAETVTPPRSCLACGSDNIVGGGRQEILIKDTPMYGKRVGIYV